MKTDSVKQLKSLIEKDDAVGPEDRREALEKMRERYRPQETPLENIGKFKQKQFDARRVDFSRWHKPSGIVYGSSPALFFSIAKFFARLPAAGELEQSLKAAGIAANAETFLAHAAVVSTVSFALVVVVLSALFGAQDVAATLVAAGVAGVLAFFVAGVATVSYPSLRGAERATQIDRELPFALRHLATQIKAGLSFQKALASVASGEYGALSAELKRTLADMQGGVPTDKALSELAGRTRSKGLKQAVMQVMRALKTGGTLSDIITGIAGDVAFETRMRLRDFTEQLNLISAVFIMVAVVAPVIVTILSAITQLPLLGGGIGSEAVLLAFSGVVAMSALILLLIKRSEPAVG